MLASSYLFGKQLPFVFYLQMFALLRSVLNTNQTHWSLIIIKRLPNLFDVLYWQFGANIFICKKIRLFKTFLRSCDVANSWNKWLTHCNILWYRYNYYSSNFSGLFNLIQRLTAFEARVNIFTTTYDPCVTQYVIRFTRQAFGCICSEHIDQRAVIDTFVSRVIKTGCKKDIQRLNYLYRTSNSQQLVCTFITWVKQIWRDNSKFMLHWVTLQKTSRQIACVNTS